MKEITIKVYEYNELSDEAKQKALSDAWEINMNFNWWECLYEDAETVGLKITEFIYESGGYCILNFIEDAVVTANKIKENHGEETETYLAATEFLTKYKTLQSLLAQAIDTLPSASVIGDYSPEYQKDKDDLYVVFESDVTDAENLFLIALKKAYYHLLKQEYEYRTSTPAIEETIIANEYLFYASGKSFVD